MIAKLQEHRQYRTISMPADLDLNQILLKEA